MALVKISHRTISPTLDKLFIIEIPRHRSIHTECPNSIKRSEWAEDQAVMTTSASVADIRERFEQILNSIKNRDQTKEKWLDDIYDLICVHPQSKTMLQCIYGSRKTIVEYVLAPCLKRYSEANSSGDMIALKVVKECHNIIKLICTLISRTNTSSFPFHNNILDSLWLTQHRLGRKDRSAQIETIKLILLSISSINATKWLIKIWKSVECASCEDIYLVLARMILQKLISDIRLKEKESKYGKYQQLVMLYRKIIKSRGILKTADDIMLQQTTFRWKNNSKSLEKYRKVNRRLLLLELHKNHTTKDSRKISRESNTLRGGKSKELYLKLKTTFWTNDKSDLAGNTSPVHTRWQTSAKYKFQDRFWEFLGYPVDE